MPSLISTANFFVLLVRAFVVIGRPDIQMRTHTHRVMVSLKWIADTRFGQLNRTLPFYHDLKPHSTHNDQEGRHPMTNAHIQTALNGFFNANKFAVVGASKDPSKFGNKVSATWQCR